MKSAMRNALSGHRRDFLSITLSENVSLAILLLQSIIVARVLGPDGVGHYSVLLSQLIILGQLVCLGIPPAFTYYVRLRPNKYYSFLNEAASLLLVTAGVAGILFVLLNLFGIIDSPDVTYVGLALLYLPFIALRPLFRNGLNVKGEFRRLALIPISGAIVQTALIAGFWIAGSLTVTSAIGAFVAATVFRTASSWPTSFQPAFHLKATKRTRAIRARLFRTSWTHFGASLIVVISTQIPVLLMDLTGSDPAELGYFSRALQIAGLVPLAIQAVMPILYTHWIGKSFSAIRANLIEFFAISTFLFAAMTVIVFVFGKYIILMLFGRDFLPALEPLLILQLSALPLIATRVLSQAMGSRNLQSITIAAYGTSIMLATTLALFWGTKQPLTAYQMAFATTIGSIAATGLLILAFMKIKKNDSVEL